MFRIYSTGGRNLLHSRAYNINDLSKGIRLVHMFGHIAIHGLAGLTSNQLQKTVSTFIDTLLKQMKYFGISSGAGAGAGAEMLFLWPFLSPCYSYLYSSPDFYRFFFPH